MQKVFVRLNPYQVYMTHYPSKAPDWLGGPKTLLAMQLMSPICYSNYKR